MTNEGDKGILIINWKDVKNSRIQNIISNLYSKNQDAIEGMKYYEVEAESAEMTDRVSVIFEDQMKKDKDDARKKEERRKERSLEAFC